MTSQDIEDGIGYAETCRKAWEQERKREFPNPQVQLDFAKAMLQCPNRADHVEAQDNLDELIEEGLLIDEACYAMAVCKLKLGHLRESNEYISRVLQLDPHNGQALQLQEMLNEKINREGKLAAVLAVASVFAAVVVLHVKVLKPWLQSRQ